jgi:hypothetical protein
MKNIFCINACFSLKFKEIYNALMIETLRIKALSLPQRGAFALFDSDFRSGGGIMLFQRG